MKVKYIFMDIDGTMTRPLDGKSYDISPKTLLEDIVMKKKRLSREEAWQEIQSCGNVETQCLSEFLPVLGISQDIYFQMLQASYKPHMEICEDTKHFLIFLKSCGYNVYSATTNSIFITNVKLSLGGLADHTGCQYLTGYYPGCAFHNPQGKFAPDFYERILADGRFEPQYCMMIGDEPLRDAIPAMNAGMRYGVIIDRQQDEKFYIKNGIIYINSLDELIPKICRA